MVQKMSVSYKMNIRKHTELINVDIKLENKTPVVSVNTVQIILQIFVFKWHLKKYQKKVFFSSYTAFPLKFTNFKKKKKKKVVCSVSNAKTTVDK